MTLDGCVTESEIFLYVQYVTTVNPNILFECLNCDNLFLNLKARCLKDIARLTPETVDDATECEFCTCSKRKENKKNF